jgi:thioester reductase-like protein
MTKATAIAPVSAPANVLLTGATGFLGAFLLHELLEQTQANVYCLVRADNAPAARQRLQTNLEFYSLWHPDRSSRIIPVVGDLSQPLLGLSSEQFQTLAETIDAIYHNGGSVNFIYPYSVLKAANVLGTQEVLRLASRSQLKPVHFVSSLGVFSPIAYADGQVIREQDLPEQSAGLYGYTQSKWVAEKLIAIAQARGIPASIHRPAWIEGHSQTGICNRSDFLRSLIKGCIQLGLAPDWNMPIDIVPVDWISRAIVRLSQQNTSSGKVYNFSNPQAISWNQLVRWMCDWGYEIEQISYQQWLEKVLDRVSLDRDHALHPFRAFLTEKIPEQQMSVPEIYFQTNSIRFDSQNVVKGLANTACTYPPIDDRLLSTYFSYLIHSGFLESPQAIAIPGTATTSG